MLDERNVMKARTFIAVSFAVILLVSLPSVVYYSVPLKRLGGCPATNLSSTNVFIENQSGRFGAVLLMDKGSKGTLCLTFSYSASHLAWAPTRNGPYAEGVYPVPPRTYDYAPNLSSLVTVTSNPRNYSVPVHNESVVYTIVASDNSTGFYYLWVSDQVCRSIALAVGYSSPQVNYSDFRGYLGPVFCPFAQAADVQIFGFSGLHIIYLQRNCAVDGVVPPFC
jgi:hypothetical protein